MKCYLVARLLDKFKYISSERMQTLFKELHTEVESHLNATSTEALFIPMGGVAKSGAMISYYYRLANELPDERFLNYSDLAKRECLENGVLVLLDDVVASGHQATYEWKKLREHVDIPASCRVILATLVSCEVGVEYLDERTDFHVCSPILLTRADQPFDPICDLFNRDERLQIRQILKKYGGMLAPQHPFGYASSGLLLGFAYSTPDNTHPIFWSTAKGWTPLLRRGGSSRIPQERI